MKIFARVSFILTGLLLLPWPMFVLFALTGGDPFHPRTVAELAYAVEWFIAASYPLVWFVAWLTWLNTSRERLVPVLIAAPYATIAAMFFVEFIAHHLLSGALLQTRL